jgi:hypothetical protein
MYDFQKARHCLARKWIFDLQLAHLLHNLPDILSVNDLTRCGGGNTQ